MPVSYSDHDPTCAHDEHLAEWDAARTSHPTLRELVIGCLLGAIPATGIVLWLLGAA